LDALEEVLELFGELQDKTLKGVDANGHLRNP